MRENLNSMCGYLHDNPSSVTAKPSGSMEGGHKHRLWGQTAWVEIPAPLLTSCVTLGKLNNLSGLSCLLHEAGIIMAPALEG